MKIHDTLGSEQPLFDKYTAKDYVENNKMESHQAYDKFETEAR